MITEDQLEQLAIQWFQDTGKLASRNPSPRPSPTGRRRKTAEREALRTLTPALCLRPSPLRSGSQGEKEKDGRLAEAVRIPGSRQISRQSVARKVVGYRDMNRDMVSRFGGDSGRKWGIPTEIPAKWRDFALLERGEAESRQFSRHHGRSGRKKAHSLGRPFRARNPVGDGTQGVAVGCRMVPRWGVYNSQGFLVSQNQIKRRLNP